jgi:AraC-like DNA-binding protein
MPARSDTDSTGSCKLRRIEEHPPQQVVLSDLAAMTNMSQSHFCYATNSLRAARVVRMRKLVGAAED